MTELEKLYEVIHSCRVCPKMDRHKSLRICECTNLNTDVFIVSQALAETTLRLSGVNFYKPDGSLGSTGLLLHEFLSKFGRTVDYTSPFCVYNTEIAQCYPGKNRHGGDRKPGKDEINNCKHFFLRELEIVKPKLILLMGKSSCDAFYRYVLDIKPERPFSEEVGTVREYKSVPVIPIYHASGANRGRFNRMIKDLNLINKIKEILNA